MVAEGLLHPRSLSKVAFEKDTGGFLRALIQSYKVQRCIQCCSLLKPQRTPIAHNAVQAFPIVSRFATIAI